MVELAVILVIMAILVAIAIPTFLSERGAAQEESAQSDLSNALLAVRAVYSPQGGYPAYAVLVGTLATQAPEIVFTSGAVPTAGSTKVISASVTPGGSGIVLVAAASNGGAGETCWSVVDWDGNGTPIPHGPTRTGVSYSAWRESDSSSCTATVVPAGAVWSSSFPGGATA